MAFPFRLLLLLGLLPFTLAASLLLVYHAQQSDRISAGVTIFGTDVGRLTRAEATEAISARLAGDTKRTFLLRYDDDAFSTSLAALGVKVESADVAALADRAWAVGHEPEFRTWLKTQYALLRYGYAVPANIALDRERAAAVLGRVAGDVEHPAVSANLSVEKAGERFEVHTSPAQIGRALNVEATLDRLQQSLTSPLPSSINLVIEQTYPAITDDDIRPVANSIAAILASPIVLKDGARRWTLDTTAMAQMLEINGLDGGAPPIAVQLNADKLRQFVEKTARAADLPAQNPSLDMAGDQIVIRRGASGKLADTDATIDALKQHLTSQDRELDVVFKDDQPWLAESDLEPARAQANALLDAPITLDAPALPGIPAEKKWLLDRPLLSQLLALPNTQTLPREYGTLPVAARPRLDAQLDSGKVTNFLAREVAPWVSLDPVDAELQLKATQVEVSSPVTAAPPVATAPRRQAVGTPNGAAARGSNANDLGEADRSTVPATVRETRYTVELRNAREGRGPDYLGTFAAMQALFAAPSITDLAERHVIVRLAPRLPRVQDRDLVAAQSLANTLIGEPVVVRWKSASWTVSRDELANMLRYQTTNGALMAYLTRDGLLAKADGIARQAERRPDVPMGQDGQPLMVDVAATAASIWQVASTSPTARSVDLVWAEPDATSTIAN